MSRIVVITGANRGLGREVARQLALSGDTVIVTGRKRESAEQTVWSSLPSSATLATSSFQYSWT